MSALKKLNTTKSTISENETDFLQNPSFSAKPLKALISGLFLLKRKKNGKMFDYKEAVLVDYGGDISEEWYIRYSTLKTNGKYKLYKYRGGMNYIKNKKDRKELGNILVKSINELLEEGWRPSGEKLVIDKVHKAFDAIDLALLIKSKTLEPKSLGSYTTTADKFKEWLTNNNFQNLYINQITSKIIKSFLSELKLSGEYMPNHIRFIKAIFGTLYKEEILDVNPTDRVEIPKVSKGKTNTPPTPEEFKKISEFLQECTEFPRLRVHAGFIYNCCLRPKEIRLLKIKDVRFDLECVDVTADVAKNDKKQPIKIPKTFLKQLEYLKDYDPEWYIFGQFFEPSQKKLSESRGNKVWKRLIKEGLGIDIDEYSLKHSRAIHMHLDGARIYEIQQYARHSSPSETENYMRSMIGTNISEETLNKTREF